jgi:hypothetical protein
VNLAAGYLDPRTRPGYLANLLTTPQSGKGTGTVSVWLPAPSGMEADMVGMSSLGASSSRPAPELMATLHPMGPRVRKGLRLAVTRLGKEGLDALAAWSSNRRPVYTSIDDAGVVSTIRTPVSSMRGGRDA